ncbi:MAG: glycerophosphodiester phosphodiesterase [Gemmatimonadota bacterium]|nr:glycerophosphodiester phosphodiesterase [Gemmatimonadota bacterium]
MYRATRPGHPYLAGAPLLVAHRGGARLAPENTLVAFRQAVEFWHADILEMDVRLSSDGVVVVIHDATVDRTTDGTGRVADLPWAALRELDAGHRFRSLDGDASFRSVGVRLARFDEVLESFPHVRLNVECKTFAAAAPLARLIEHHGASQRVLIAAERDRSRAGALGYRGPWGASRGQVASVLVLGSRRAPPADILQVPERWHGVRVVTRRFVRAAHRLNLPVQVWTVDDPSDMRRLLALGVDGIQTDRPDRLAGVLAETVGRPPAPGAARGRV